MLWIVTFFHYFGFCIFVFAYVEWMWMDYMYFKLMDLSDSLSSIFLSKTSFKFFTQRQSLYQMKKKLAIVSNHKMTINWRIYCAFSFSELKSGEESDRCCGYDGFLYCWSIYSEHFNQKINDCIYDARSLTICQVSLL